jgi:hypothetical protein
MGAHAKLGASSAYRWMACPASIRLSEGQDGRSSIYAMEGTAAHELAAACLNTHTDAADHLDAEIQVEDMIFVIDEEMAEAVQVYLDAVRAAYDEKTDILWVEKKFSLEHLHPDMWGTNDAAVYKPYAKKLIIFDYKHGKGISVDVEDNPQLKMYGIGAWHSVENLEVAEVELVVVQPRCAHKDGPVRPWTISTLDLMDWSMELVARAKDTLDPNAAIAPGDHCRFCDALKICAAAAEYANASAQKSFAVVPLSQGFAPPEPETLTAEEMGAVLARGELIDAWLNAVRAHTKHLADSGVQIPGWKLVDKRKTRKWVDEADVKMFLTHDVGLDDAEIHTEPKLRSPAQIEKLVPAPMRPQLDAHINAASSGTNLVRDVDAREPVSPRVQTVFTPIENQNTKDSSPWEI